jgi:hypothetical protein
MMLAYMIDSLLHLQMKSWRMLEDRNHTCSLMDFKGIIILKLRLKKKIRLHLR